MSGKAITSYKDPELEIPPEEGQEYTSDECVSMCITFNYGQQQSSSYDENTKPEDLWFHVVGNGNCYCKAKPEFAEEPAEGPDTNDLPVALNDDDDLPLDVQFDDELYDDDDDDGFDDIPIDYVEGSEDDPLVQEKRKKEQRKKRRRSRIKQRPVDVMTTLAEAPEDDDDSLKPKRVKTDDEGLEDNDDGNE